MQPPVNAQPLTLDSLKVQYTVTDVQLDQLCAPEDLDEISDQIGNYTLYTDPLGLTPADVADIHVNPQWNYKQKVKKVLLKWRWNAATPTYRQLVVVALGVKDGRVAHKVCEKCASHHVGAGGGAVSGLQSVSNTAQRNQSEPSSPVSPPTAGQVTTSSEPIAEDKPRLLPPSQRSKGEVADHSQPPVTQDLDALVVPVEGLDLSEGGIGFGAYGVVFEVTMKGKKCIAKKLHNILLQTNAIEQREQIVEKFRNECRILSGLNHPNIVSFVGVHYGHDKDDISLIMERLHTDLAAFVAKNPSTAISYRIHILHDVSCGLDYLHGLCPPLIHRDITAPNVLLTEDLTAKIGDLGVSRFVDPNYAKVLTTNPGNLLYMPPECRVENPTYSTQLDIFSFGNLIIHTVNGKLPDVFDISKRNPNKEQYEREGKIELMRRNKAVHKQMGENHCLYPLVVHCLHDEPDLRPKTEELRVTLRKLCGRYPRETFLEACKNGHVATVQVLLEDGADPNQADEDNRTALHWASNNGHDEVVRVLIQAKAIVDIQDKFGQTPLLSAKLHGHQRAVELLIQAGTNVDVQKEDFMEPERHTAERRITPGSEDEVRGTVERTEGAVRAAPPTSSYTATLEEEWEERNRERLINTVSKANRLVQEANMLADALHKDTVFRVTLTVPRSFLSPRQTLDSDEISTNNEVAIRVLHKQRGTDSVWTTDTLEEKVLIMRDMYEKIEEGGSPLDVTLEPDPFYDLEQDTPHALLGVANFLLDCLHYDIAHEYTAPIVAASGKECGHLKVAIQRVPTQVDCDPGEDVDLPEVCFVEYGDANLQPGVTFSCQIYVIEATGLPKEYCHNVFCQYQLWNDEDPLIVPPLVQSGQEKISDPLQRFEHSKVFTIPVTDEFLQFIDNGALAVEVWGHRRSGFLDVPGGLRGMSDGDLEEGKEKSFPERWSELTQRLELWVEVMELNDQGEYIPVEIQSKPDVNTGGVFMIRQGQSRRINVAVRTVPGSGNSPLKCDYVSSVSMGSIYLRNRYDEPLDSFQSRDLNRLRKKWSDALMNRREYLDTEVRKIMDKREPTKEDLERQNDMLDQWAMLQWQRAAVFQPKAGSGVPGAPTSWNLVPAFETRVPVLFLDLSDDLLTPCDDDPVAAVSTGPLFGEKDENMIALPIIKRDERVSQPQATASWDSAVHNANCLNKITGNNDRVYAILKVGVALSHPPGVELVLRKRICLRVYKSIGLGAYVIRAFGGTEQRTTCGVMYEVVMGIPKSEGMQPPPKIPANPSFVELQEDENAVEKFKTIMTSITSILSLDRLKQEVSLKEKLTKSGKPLRKRITLGEATKAETTPINEAKDLPVAVSPTPPQGEEPATEGASVVSLSSSPVNETEDLPVVLSTTPPQGEESCTIGTSVVFLSSPPVNEAEEKQLVSIPEESLEVDTEKVDAILEEEGSPKVKRTASPTPSTGSESSSESGTPSKPPPPPCTIGEKVMVEVSKLNGFRIGVVKYIGETEFQPGEWIGVALDRPDGKHNGTVKGVRYFKCKDKHGLFVRPDKIIYEPGSWGSPGTTGRSSLGKNPSPLTSSRRVASNPNLHLKSSSKRTHLGPRR